MKAIQLFITACMLFITVFAGENNTPKTYSNEYFPLKQVSGRKFDSNIGDTKFDIKQQGNVFQINYDAPKVTYSQKMISKKDGVYIVETSNEVLLWSNKIHYKKPLLRIPFPLKENDTWYFETMEYKENGDSNVIKLAGKVLGEEKAATPAGTFDCLKIQLTITAGDNKPSVLTEWLVKDLGVVKFEAKVGSGGIVGLFQKILGYDVVYYTLRSY